MNNKILYSLISSSLLLTACGSGSKPDSNVASSYLLKGTVPGTLIEAYCDDGSTYSVSSTKNGTNKHPFELKLPADKACRIVMITNEDDLTKKLVTPIKFKNSQGQSSIAITSHGNDIEIGHVNLALSRTEAGVTDDNADGVKDTPEVVEVADNDINIITKPAGSDPLDKDGDDIINVYEDNDGDGIPNHDDDDDDNDGIKDIDDINDNDVNNQTPDNDLDGDGVENKSDVDDDNDERPDTIDNDDDNDGIEDAKDTDDDNDGIDDINDPDHDDSDPKDADNSGVDNGTDDKDHRNDPKDNN